MEEGVNLDAGIMHYDWIVWIPVLINSSLETHRQRSSFGCTKTEESLSCLSSHTRVQWSKFNVVFRSLVQLSIQTVGWIAHGNKAASKLHLMADNRPTNIVLILAKPFYSVLRDDKLKIKKTHGKSTPTSKSDMTQIRGGTSDCLQTVDLKSNSLWKPFQKVFQTLVKQAPTQQFCNEHMSICDKNAYLSDEILMLSVSPGLQLPWSSPTEEPRGKETARCWGEGGVKPFWQKIQEFEVHNNAAERSNPCSLSHASHSMADCKSTVCLRFLVFKFICSDEKRGKSIYFPPGLQILLFIVWKWVCIEMRRDLLLICLELAWTW